MFQEWSRKILIRRGFGDGRTNYVTYSAKEAVDQEVRAEIRRGNYGVVLIGRNRITSYNVCYTKLLRQWNNIIRTLVQ